MEGMEGNTVDVASAVALRAEITIDTELLNFMVDVILMCFSSELIYEPSASGFW